jgi:hypothetical protein
MLSCNQDPIFYLISKEVAPRDPTINGSPSKMVKTSGTTNYDIYTANGKLWKFSGNSWNTVSSPGSVFDVATVGDTLYIMTLSGVTGTVYKRESGAWTEIANDSGYEHLQSIWGCDNALFASSRSGSDDYAILQLVGGNFTAIKTNTRDLTGVAYAGGTYYFATSSNGVYTGTGGGSVTVGGQIPGTTSMRITGIFAYKSTVIAVTLEGVVLDLSSSPIKGYSKAYSLSGSICLWQRKLGDTSSECLLLGVKGGSDNYGYYEMKINNGTIAWSGFSEPGDLKPDSSVDDQDTYRQQLKKHLVKSIMQAPATAEGSAVGLPVVFASTQKNGLWSYRKDSDNPAGVWNAE